MNCCDSAGLIRVCGDGEGNCRRAALLTETAVYVTRVLAPAKVLANTRFAATTMPSHCADVKTQSRRSLVCLSGVIHFQWALYPKPITTSKTLPTSHLWSKLLENIPFHRNVLVTRKEADRVTTYLREHSEHSSVPPTRGFFKASQRGSFIATGNA